MVVGLEKYIKHLNSTYIHRTIENILLCVRVYQDTCSKIKNFHVTFTELFPSLAFFKVFRMCEATVSFWKKVVAEKQKLAT